MTRTGHLWPFIFKQLHTRPWICTTQSGCHLLNTTVIEEHKFRGDIMLFCTSVQQNNKIKNRKKKKNAVCKKTRSIFFVPLWKMIFGAKATLHRTVTIIIIPCFVSGEDGRARRVERLSFLIIVAPPKSSDGINQSTNRSPIDWKSFNHTNQDALKVSSGRVKSHVVGQEFSNFPTGTTIVGQAVARCQWNEPANDPIDQVINRPIYLPRLLNCS